MWVSLCDFIGVFICFRCELFLGIFVFDGGLVLFFRCVGLSKSLRVVGVEGRSKILGIGI